MENINTNHKMLPATPKHITTIDGQLVDTATDFWSMKANANGGRSRSINWNLLASVKHNGLPVLSKQTICYLKLFCLNELKTRMPATAYSACISFKAFADELKKGAERRAIFESSLPFMLEEFDEDFARDYLAFSTQSRRAKGDVIRHMRKVYQWAVTTQMEGFDAVTLNELRTITLKSHSTAVAVRHRDPISGPFSDEEKHIIVTALKQKCGSPYQRALVMLFLELGIRPQSAAMLRNEHLIEIETSRNMHYRLDVPLSKQASAKLRTKRKRISEPLAKTLKMLAQGKPGDPLLHWIEQSSIRKRANTFMHKWAAENNLISPRTGQPLRLNARRFRYTLATQMAEDGASSLHIAEALDHAGTHSAHIYIETSSKIAKSVAKATDGVMEPLVRRFLGQIVDDASDEAQTLPLIAGAAPHISHLSTAAIGACGRNVAEYGLCKLYPPLSCYLCMKFVAFKSAPHEELRQSIIAFTKEQKQPYASRLLKQLRDVELAIREIAGDISAAQEGKQNGNMPQEPSNDQANQPSPQGVRAQTWSHQAEI